MKKLRALFIDPVAKTVTETTIENDLHTMYARIGCHLIQVVEYRDELIVCDEEGRLNPWTHGFQLADWRIVGKALILGEDEDGDFAESKLTPETIANEIRFFGREEKFEEPRTLVLGFC